MKSKVGLYALGLLFSLTLSGYAGDLVDSTRLAPKSVYGKEARLISNILDTYHYRKIKFDDSLSSAILDRYILDLDNNKTYFLASDLKSFERYRNMLDDLTKREDVTPAYEIYAVFRDRYRQRLDYVLNDLVKRDFDFTKDEYYQTDRDNEPWAATQAELNEIWRKIIKGQALSLKLAGKKPDEINETLRKRYERFRKSVEQFNSEDVFNIYMNSITEAYDPHTNYFSPKASDLFKQEMSLSLEGIGATLQTDNDYTKVVTIVPGGPAQKSDLIHVNDLIIGVAQGRDGEMVDVIGWRIDEVVKLIKGPKGTTVRLQLLPAKTGVNGPVQEIMLVRDRIQLEDRAAKKRVINYTLSGKSVQLGVITLPNFYMDFDQYQKGNADYRSTTRDVKKLILELQREGVEGIVMDLRNNGGGSLPEAINLAGLFIKDGPVVQIKGSDNQVQIGNDEDKQVVYNGPLVVLTNRFSASASEIFAGAIQDYQRGIIVGESTFGKGTVQTVLDLNRFINDKEKVGQLNLTIQKFYRVTGSSTQHKGVVPDVKLPTALDAKQFGESASVNALPWDVIKSTSFQKVADVNDRIIAGINRSHQERLKFDESLKRYVDDTNELRKNLEQTRLSLNEATRRKEMEAAEQKKARDQKLNTKVSGEDGLQSNNLDGLDDEFLREGLLVLSDLVSRRIG